MFSWGLFNSPISLLCSWGKGGTIAENSPVPQGKEEKVIEMIRQFHLEDRILFSSFNPVSMLKCKKLIPEIPAGFLMETRMDNMGVLASENGVEFYHPDINFLTEEQVKECHEKGIGVNVWTVNKKKHMRRMAEWKVDGIITNFPNKAMKLRNKEKI